MKSLTTIFTVALATFNAVYSDNCRPKICTVSVRDTYTVSCGFFGWSRCLKYRIGYKLGVCGEICDPVDCKWGAWTDEEGSCSNCSTECGGGEQTCTMTRSIIQSKAHGGEECSGSNAKTDTRKCNQHHCPVDCKWTDWVYGEWEQCLASCGYGLQSRTMTRRYDPPADHGGKECEGASKQIQTRQCNTKPCPVDCKWGEWSKPVWSVCSRTCGGGKQSRLITRTKQPPASNGGKDCTGNPEKQEFVECNIHPCPIDGSWSKWSNFSEWTECTINCDQNRTQSRTCSEPSPAHGGRDCDGSALNCEIRNCYQGDCLDQACLSQSYNRAELPRNCKQFVVCQDKEHVVQDCPTNTHWNQTQLTCVHQASSDCKDGNDEEEAPTTMKPDLEICVWPKYTSAGMKCRPCTENFVDTDDCTDYWFWCVGGLAYRMSCPPGTYYDKNSAKCDAGSCS